MKRKTKMSFPATIYVQEIREAEYKGLVAYADIRDAPEADLSENAACTHVAIYRLESVGRIDTRDPVYVETKKVVRHGSVR